MKFLTRILAPLTAFFSPALAFAQGTFSQTTFFSTGVGFFGGYGGVACANTICGIADTILYIINNVLVPLIFAIAFIVFLYGIAKAYIFSHGDPEEVSKGHKLVLWGIIAFVIMISIWGLVNVVANTFGLGGYYAPDLPSSYRPY